MFDAWFGPALLLLFMLGMVRCVVAWLIYREYKEWLQEQPMLQPQPGGTRAKCYRRPAKRWNHDAHWRRRRVRHAVQRARRLGH